MTKIILGEMDGQPIWRDETSFDKIAKVLDEQSITLHNACPDCGNQIEGEYDDKCQACIDRDWNKEIAKEDGKII